MKDKYITTIRNRQKPESLVYNYPRERLGLGDRYLLNLIIREALDDLDKNPQRPNYGFIFINSPIGTSMIADRMKEFGFKAKDNVRDFPFKLNP